MNMKSLVVPALLFLAFVAPRDVCAQGAFIGQSGARLGKSVDEANKNGFEVQSGGISGGLLRQSESEWITLFQVRFEEGREYLMLAAGDEDARDVDIRVMDGNGRQVAVDAAADSRDPDARVSFRPTSSGVYSVDVRLYASERNQPCICMGAVLVKTDAPSTTGAAVVQAARRVGGLVDIASKNGCKIMNVGIDGGLLRQGKDGWVELVSRTLDKNFEYLMLVSGDDAARDIDVEVRDASGNQVAIDHVSSREPSAMVLFRPSATGKYTVRARLFESERNRSAVCVSVAMFRAAGGANNTTGNLVANPTRVYEVKAGAPIAIDGELKLTDENDSRRRDCRSQVHRFKLERAKTYVIDMTSPQLDSFLRLEDSRGTQLAENDDGGEGLNSRIEFTPQAEGEFRIITTTAVSNTQGRYTLTVREK